MPPEMPTLGVPPNKSPLPGLLVAAALAGHVGGGLYWWNHRGAAPQTAPAEGTAGPVVAAAPAPDNAGAPEAAGAPTAPTPAPAPPPTQFQPSGPELRSGSTGVDVALLQARLLQRGFWVAEQLGKFGESTRHAVVAFQKFYGLRRTGKVDFWTRIGIASSGDRATPRVPSPSHSIDIDLTRQVMVIQTGGRVDEVVDVSTGKKSTPTPKGSFRVTRQIRGKRVSDLGVLFSPKYFTGGYAIHGSNSVPNYAASHGCVRVTNQTINHLWAVGLAELGTPVTLS